LDPIETRNALVVGTPASHERIAEYEQIAMRSPPLMRELTLWQCDWERANADAARAVARGDREAAERAALRRMQIGGTILAIERREAHDEALRLTYAVKHEPTRIMEALRPLVEELVQEQVQERLQNLEALALTSRGTR
jgi:hypothetical protein